MSEIKKTPSLPYSGLYTVELIPETDISFLPQDFVNVETDKKTGIMTVTGNGEVQDVMGGIQFYSHKRAFGYGYIHIRCVRDTSGNLLWVNRHFKNEINE